MTDTLMRYCKDCSYFGEEVEGVFEPKVHLYKIHIANVKRSEI